MILSVTALYCVCGTVIHTVLRRFGCPPAAEPSVLTSSSKPCSWHGGSRSWRIELLFRLCLCLRTYVRFTSSFILYLSGSVFEARGRVCLWIQLKSRVVKCGRIEKEPSEARMLKFCLWCKHEITEADEDQEWCSPRCEELDESKERDRLLDSARLQ